MLHMVAMAIVWTSIFLWKKQQGKMQGLTDLWLCLFMVVHGAVVIRACMDCWRQSLPTTCRPLSSAPTIPHILRYLSANWWICIHCKRQRFKRSFVLYALHSFPIDISEDFCDDFIDIYWLLVLFVYSVLFWILSKMFIYPESAAKHNKQMCNKLL